MGLTSSSVTTPSVSPTSVSSASVSCPTLTFKDDGYFTEDGDKISGVAVLVRNGPDKSDICTENRVALTKEEQKEIGDKQPLMLPETCIGVDGNVINDNVIFEAIMKKYDDAGKVLKLTPGPPKNLKDKVLMQARSLATIFTERHFPMAILREGIKNLEHPDKALIRLLKEEHQKKIKSDLIPPRYKFKYKRKPNSKTCVLVYFVQNEHLEPDEYALSKKGKCNYFCAKAIPEICDNDYQETKNHKILDNSEIENILIEFQQKFNQCDLSRWGGLKMWLECKKYF